MGFFKWLFGKNTPPSKRVDENPPIYGGDAVTPQTSAILNCYAMSTANYLIDRFISELHGQKDCDWKRSLEFFVNAPGVPEFTVRAIRIITSSGEKLTYYFNGARPMNGTKKLLKAMGKIPEDI